MPPRRAPRPDPSRLAAAVRARRHAQGWSQRAVAERGGLGLPTVVGVERGTTAPRAFTCTRLDAGLGWPPGTAAAVLAGTGDPPPADSPLAAPDSPTRVPQLSTPDLTGIYERLARLEGKLDALLALVAGDRRGT
ncbi:helix-turn-helix domain-containing protein [Aciditerrimonas ferrireducens]|uniref:Helix-turn-helix domain-containing protein n=1 Tax=Aciditerrimonas ferrireducens TaxID=667306 RepID=A0ABV6C2R5_9ACTN